MADHSALLEHFKDTLRQLCTLIEDLQIQNFVYFDTILDIGGVNLPALEERLEEAKRDPVKRNQVHEMYSQMWEGLETSGLAAFFEGLLKDLPPTDKPN